MALEDDYRALSDEDLRAKTQEFKDRLAAGEPLDTKPVSMAIDEVYDGRLQVVHKE